MTLFSRVATVAAMTLSLAGLVATTPGWAHGVDQSLIATPALATLNTLAPHVVPAVATQDMVEPQAPETAAPDDTDQDFDSLAEAVAAQDTGADISEAIRCLAGAIYFESKGEPLSGQLAVAEVILNRANSGRFPDGVCEVVTQRGQFGFVRGGRIPAIDEARNSWRTAVAVARVALAGAWDSDASEALYFNTPGRKPHTGIRRIAAIGNHIFYR